MFSHHCQAPGGGLQGSPFIQQGPPQLSEWKYSRESFSHSETFTFMSAPAQHFKDLGKTGCTNQKKKKNSGAPFWTNITGSFLAISLRKCWTWHPPQATAQPSEVLSYSEPLENWPRQWIVRQYLGSSPKWLYNRTLLVIVYSSGSQLGKISLPRHMAMPGDIFGCHNW